MAVDRVITLSLRSDGTPDQTDGFVVLDPATATAAATKAFRENDVAAADKAWRLSQLAGEKPALGALVTACTNAANGAAAKASTAVGEGES